MNGAIRPEVFAAMMAENTATWESVAASMALLPVELIGQLWAMFGRPRADLPQNDAALEMLFRGMQAALAGEMSDDLMDLMLAYRERVFGDSPSDNQIRCFVEALASTAISLTFLAREIK